MELCTPRAISNLTFHMPRPYFAPNHVRTVLQCGTRFPVRLKQSRFNYGLRYHAISCLSSTTEAITTEEIAPEAISAELTAAEETKCEATTLEGTAAEKITTYDTTGEVTTPEETKAEATSYVKNEPESDCMTTVEVEESPSVEKKAEYINQLNEVPRDSSFDDDPLQLLKILENLNIKFDDEQKYSYLALGVGALIAIWISAAVIRAIDSIPLLPKGLELIGLGYTLWFGSRYLIFEQNREELVDRVVQFKQQVLGSEDD